MGVQGYLPGTEVGVRGLSVTLSVGTPLYHYGFSYRRVSGLSNSGVFLGSAALAQIRSALAALQ